MRRHVAVVIVAAFIQKNYECLAIEISVQPLTPSSSWCSIKIFDCLLILHSL